MLWIKALHIVAMVAWFAGLFYLPRLFVYHADCHDEPGQKRFLLMERKLYRLIMLPAALVTIGSGLWLLFDYAWASYSRAGWLHTKLLLVALLAAYHWQCGRWLARFGAGTNPHGARFYRIANEVPTLLLVAIVVLVVVKPF